MVIGSSRIGCHQPLQQQSHRVVSQKELGHCQEQKESWQLEQFMEQARQLDFKRVIEELRQCSSLEERETKFREAANRMGVTGYQMP